MEMERAPKMSCFFKKLDNGINPPPKKKIFQLTSVVLCSLDFLTLEDGADRLSENVSKELPLNAAYLRRTETPHDDLAMQAMVVWLCMVQFRAIWFDTVHFIHEFKMTSYLSAKFKEELCLAFEYTWYMVKEES